MRRLVSLRTSRQTIDAPGGILRQTACFNISKPSNAPLNPRLWLERPRSIAYQTASHTKPSDLTGLDDRSILDFYLGVLKYLFKGTNK